MTDTKKSGKKKKYGSVSAQVLGVYWCVLILIFGINGFVMYRYMIRQKTQYFLQSAQQTAEEVAEYVEEFLPGKWLLDYWDKNPEALQRVQESDLEEYRDAYDSLDRKYTDEWGYYDVTQSEFDALPPIEQEALSKYFYEDIELYSAYIREELSDAVEGPIIIGSRSGKPPKIYYCGSKDYHFITNQSLDIPELQLDNIRSNSLHNTKDVNRNLSTIALKAETDSGEAKLDVISCRINTGNDDLAAFVLIGVDMPYLRKQSAGSILRMVAIDLLISTLLGFVLMQILYRLILKPVTRIQKGLRDYVESGDTSQVVKTMDSVRAENEIGYLAKDIGNMVQEMEAHVRARQQFEDEQKKMAEELEHAARIQKGMLPKVFPDRSKDPRVELYASMTPAKEVGGDLYDFFMVDQDHLALVVADVSGKGIPAALFMMEAKTLLRDTTHPGIPVDKIIEQVNHRLYAFNEAHQFITTWMMIVNLTSGRAMEVNAGHTRPAFCRCQGSYALVMENHDLALAVRDQISFTVNRWQLNAGDRIFVYTDGISEAENGSKELFGTDRMLAVLNETRMSSQRETIAYVSDSVHKFAGETPQADDITMLGITFYGNS